MTAQDHSQALRESLDASSTTAHVKALELLRNVASRSRALRKPQLILCNPREPSFNRTVPYQIAMISMPIRIKIGDVYVPQPESSPVPPLRDICLLQRSFDHFTLCVRNDEEDISELEDWCKILINEVDQALTREPTDAGPVKFLVVNELGFPNFWIGKLDRRDVERTRYRLAKLNARLYDDLQARATKFQAIIIGGTAHDPSTFQSWGPIFFPEPDKLIDHKKLTTAYRTDEYIKPALGPNYPIYQLGGLSFSVLVCSDAFDLNIFFEPLVQPTPIPQSVPDIVFVPSFYDHNEKRHHALRMACEQMSVALDVIVVFCNQFHDKMRHAVFFAGRTLELTNSGLASSLAQIDTKRLAPFREQVRPVRDELIGIFRGAVSTGAT